MSRHRPENRGPWASCASGPTRASIRVKQQRRSCCLSASYGYTASHNLPCGHTNLQQVAATLGIVHVLAALHRCRFLCCALSLLRSVSTYSWHKSWPLGSSVRPQLGWRWASCPPRKFTSFTIANRYASSDHWPSLFDEIEHLIWGILRTRMKGDHYVQ